MSATHMTDSTTATMPVLYLALELSWTSWKLAFTVGAGQKPRLRSIPARDTDALMLEIRKAKDRFGLPEEAPVISCYEAGRDGFWLDRFLRDHRVENLVVDSSSIEVNRRRRRAKSDGLDATKLVGMLIRWHLGERKLWGIVRVPTADDEDRRQLHRELIELKAQRTAPSTSTGSRACWPAWASAHRSMPACSIASIGSASGMGPNCPAACGSGSPASSSGGVWSGGRSTTWRRSGRG